MKDKEYLINESPAKAIFYFSLPILLGNLFQQTYTLVDSVVVGRYVSEEALAASGASFSFTNIFIWIAIGGGIGSSVIVSRYFGERKYGKMKSAIYSALISFLVVSILLAGIGLLIGRRIMILINTPEDVLPLAMVYLNIYFLGLPFLFMYNIVSSMFNALGKSKIPLYFLIFSSVLNIFLDIFMVCSLNMGIAGVAWATLIAQGLSAVLSFIVLMKDLRGYHGNASVVQSAKANIAVDDAKGEIPEGSNIRNEEKVAIFDWKEVRKMTSVALPSIVQQSTVSIGMLVVQSVVNSFGAEILAGYSAGIRIDGFCCVPWSAFNSALSTYVAQNLGAGKEVRVHQGYRAVNRLIGAFCVFFFLLLEPLAPAIVKGFLGSNLSDVSYAIGVSYIRFMGVFIGLLGFKMAVDGVLRGAADTRAFTIANLVNLGLRIVISFVCAPIFGVQFVWYSSPIGWSANWLISYGHYHHRYLAKK